MSERFGDAAARLCNAASQLVGWRPKEFWDATPAELALTLRAPDGDLEGPNRAMIEALQQRFPDRRDVTQT